MTDTAPLKESSQKEYQDEGEFDGESADSLKSASPTNSDGGNSFASNSPQSEPKEDSLLSECTFTILLNRYNQEIEQISRLRNQSVFILTIVGFLISCSVGVMGANWFELSIIPKIPILVWSVLGIELVFCIFPAAIGLIYVSISSHKYYMNYPGQDMYTSFNFINELNRVMNIDDDNNLCSDNRQFIINRYVGSSFNELCVNLEKITYQNLQRNLKSRVFIVISAVALPIFLITLVILFIWLIGVNLETSTDIICNCSNCIVPIVD